MDRTLKTAKRKNKRRSNRNYGAWQRLSPDGKRCRFCPHDGSKHLCQSGQPHFYRPATEEERRDPSERLYHYESSEHGSVPVKRVIVARQAELLTAFCKACAEELNTGQVLCYQRTLATGEVVGLKTHAANMTNIKGGTL